jgi:precorrin-6B methylase 2
MSDEKVVSEAGAGRAWLVRVPDVFEGVAAEVLASVGTVTVTGTRLGQEFQVIKVVDPARLRSAEAGLFVPWNLPLEHTWPCHPAKMEGFIEKAAQTLWKKFGARGPQGIFIGQLNPSAPDRYYRSLAANLRGRVLQLFPALPAGGVEEQDPGQETLFGMVGKEGLFCGMTTPRAANGFYPGGSKFIDQEAAETISRAGAKIAEALHYLRLHRAVPAAGSHWLELGACPGGMTAELLAREQRVTAVDRSPLDARLKGRAGLTFAHTDVAVFEPKPGVVFDAMLSDLNGPPEESIEQVIRLSGALKPGGLVVFTLKVAKVEPGSAAGTWARVRRIEQRAKEAGLRLLARTHLTYNRHEFTLFLERGR